MNTGSFLFHVVPFDTDSHQHFDIQYFSVERKFSKDSDYSLMVGTFINIQANRWFLLGLRKDWHRMNKRLVIKGVYSYVGEFFFDTFESCGDGVFLGLVSRKQALLLLPIFTMQHNITLMST